MLSVESINGIAGFNLYKFEINNIKSMHKWKQIINDLIDGILFMLNKDDNNFYFWLILF